MLIHEGEVWFVKFPYEEDSTRFSNRPVVVLDVDTRTVLSVKITKHEVRAEDKYDTPIIYWQQAGLKFASTARISKVMNLPIENFRFKIGELDSHDLDIIADAYIEFMESQKKEQGN